MAVGENCVDVMGYHDPYMVWYRGITRRWHTMHASTIDHLVSAFIVLVMFSIFLSFCIDDFPIPWWQVDALAHIKFWISSDDQIAARPHINTLATDALQIMHAEYRIPDHQPHTSAHDMSPEREVQNFPRPFPSMEEHYNVASGSHFGFDAWDEQVTATSVDVRLNEDGVGTSSYFDPGVITQDIDTSDTIAIQEDVEGGGLGRRRRRRIQYDPNLRVYQRRQPNQNRRPWH